MLKLEVYYAVYQVKNLKKIKFGVIGCGVIAKKSIIPSLKQSKKAELVSIASRDKYKAESIAKIYDCNYDNNYESLLKNTDIDVVYISTVPSTHEEIIILAARYGKHILCEKPLALSYDSAIKIVNHTQKNNVGLFEGFMYQFHSQHKIIKNLIKNGHIGFPILFQAQFGFPPFDKKNFRYNKNLGGGALLDAGCYTIHAARNFFKREPINVKTCINLNNEDIDIHGSILLDFGNSQTAFLSYGFNNSYRNNYTIWGTKGHLSVNRAFSVTTDYKPKIILEKQDVIKEILCDNDNQFVNQIDYFCDNILKENIQKSWAKELLMQSKVMNEVKNKK